MATSQDFDLIADLPDDGSRQKEVYARFGLAAYLAQVFDHGLVNLLAVADRIDGPIEADDVDALWDKYFSKTSGLLVKAAESKSRLGPADVDLCRRAVDRRNFLIHHFFRMHAEDFFTDRGRQLMVDELDAIAELFKLADAACHRVLLKLGARYGITEQAIEEQFARMREDIAD